MSVVAGKQGHCVFQGLTMFHQAVWAPKPCVTCLCTGGRVVCDEITCPTMHCDFPFTPAGECCPVCMESGRSTTCGNAMVPLQEATGTSSGSHNQGFLRNILRIVSNLIKRKTSAFVLRLWVTHLVLLVSISEASTCCFLFPSRL